MFLYYTLLEALEEELSTLEQKLGIAPTPHHHPHPPADDSLPHAIISTPHVSATNFFAHSTISSTMPSTTLITQPQHGNRAELTQSSKHVQSLDASPATEHAASKPPESTDHHSTASHTSTHHGSNHDSRLHGAHEEKSTHTATHGQAEMQIDHAPAPPPPKPE